MGRGRPRLPPNAAAALPRSLLCCSTHQTFPPQPSCGDPGGRGAAGLRYQRAAVVQVGAHLSTFLRGLALPETFPRGDLLGVSATGPTRGRVSEPTRWGRELLPKPTLRPCPIAVPPAPAPFPQPNPREFPTLRTHLQQELARGCDLGFSLGERGGKKALKTNSEQTQGSIKSLREAGHLPPCRQARVQAGAIRKEKRERGISEQQAERGGS